MDTSTNTMRKVFNAVSITVFIVGFIVGFGSASLWAKRSRNTALQNVSETPASTEAASQKTQGTNAPFLAGAAVSFTGGQDTIKVDDQAAGDSVAISSAALSARAWVVIHEDYDGKPGRILGAQLFPGGVGSGKVDLLRPSMEGKTYYAMLHTDDGDHAFDMTKDLPMKDQAGMPIMVKFVALPIAGAQ